MDDKAKRREQKRIWAAKNREKLKANGLVQVSGFVHRSQVPEVQALIALLASNPDYSIATLRDLATGKYLKVI